MVDRDELLRQVDLGALLDELSPGPPARLGPGARWRCIDPHHADQHPSVTMFTDQRGIPRWRCWSGGHGGTAIDALLVARGGTIGDAIAELQRPAGLAIDNQRSRPAPAAPTSSGPAPQPDPALFEYVAACERLLWRPAGRPVLDYLVHQRHLAPDVLEGNHVGADPGPDLLRRAPGLPRSGLAAVLPTLDTAGQITYVQARYLHPAPNSPRYDNPASRLAPNPRTGWTTPTRPRHRDLIVVCEGTIDALTAADTGTAAVALLGASYANQPTANAIASGAAGRTVVLALDADPAGCTATQTLAAALARLGCPTRTLALPPGHDLNDFAARHPSWLDRQIEHGHDPTSIGPILNRQPPTWPRER